jgi:hypothetical protein
MDNLPDWAVSIIAVVVGISPALAVLSARRIARLLHRALWPRPEEAAKPGRKPAQEKPAAVATLPG